jgi:hypothetical protein
MTTHAPVAESATNFTIANGLPYAAISAAAVELLRRDVEAHGIQDALNLPSQRPTPLSLYKEGWYGGTEFDEYAYIATSLINATSARIPEHPPKTKEARAADDIKGFYGQLGASILLRCVEKGTTTYLESARFPNKTSEECSDILRRSFDPLVSTFANTHNSLGSRLEILYDLSRRGQFRYQDFADSIENRFAFELTPSDPPIIVPQGLSLAQFDAERYPELEPEIPQSTKGICPLNAPATQKYNTEGQQALRVLWGIAIQACQETPWMFPEIIDQTIKTS